MRNDLEELVRVTQPIDGSAFNPETVRIMGNVLDSAWAAIAPAFREQPQAITDRARTLLANTVIARVKLGVVHPGTLATDAIEVVRSHFPSLRF